MIAKEYGLPIFDGAVSTWSKSKSDLAQWVLFYRNVYDIPEKERPPEKIWDKLIDYDLVLDEWLEQRKYKQEQAAKGGRSAQNESETYVMS